MKNKDFLKGRVESMVAMAEGESVVKTYHLATLNHGESEAYVTLTDRRLMVSRVSQHDPRDRSRTELALAAVGGMEYSFRKGRNGGKIATGLFFLAACAALIIIPFFVTLTPLWLKYVFWGGAGACGLLALILFALHTPDRFEVVFYATPLDTPVRLSGAARERETGPIRLDVLPAEDAKVFLREFGAVVDDVRRFGAQAKERYLSKVEQKELRAEHKTEEKKRRYEEQLAAERAERLEEKARRRRIKEQRKLERESEKRRKAQLAAARDAASERPKKRKKDDDEDFFDILNK